MAYQKSLSGSKTVTAENKSNGNVYSTLNAGSSAFDRTVEQYDEKRPS